jgi:membrane protein YdbS with pleckstrin-like domain
VNDRASETGRWIYQGVWAVLVDWLRVPDTPPQLPAAAGERIDVFQPATGFLGYMKLQFWIVLVVISVVIFVVWLIVTVAVPPVGLLLALPAVALVVLPMVVSYVALHLRYDTTWYVISERSLRIRRGIWVIRETTITYDNIQNIRVSQGPIERYFGIANLLVETAGGGGGQDPQTAGMNLNRGLIEGVDNAHKIRDLISARLRQSTTAGLGDDDENANLSGVAPAMSLQHVALLRQIRDAVQQLEAA